MPLRAIGIDQQPGGSFYPFVKPPAGWNWLFADFWVEVYAPRESLETPLKISRLTGFGTGPATAFEDIDYLSANHLGEALIGRQTPLTPRTTTHNYDLILVDADDRFVLDTVTATHYRESPWNSDLLVVEWAYSSVADLEKNWIVRAVLHVGLRTAEDYPANYAQDALFSPGIALDERATFIDYRRIKSLMFDGWEEPVLYGSAAFLRVTDSPLILSAGYNTRLDWRKEPARDGQEFYNVVTVNFIAGEGSGRVPVDCTKPEQWRVLSSINNIQPDEQGRFFIETDDCGKIEGLAVSATLSGEVSSQLHSEFWVGEQGRYDVQIFPNALRLIDSCPPCVTCEDFAAVYRALRRLAEMLVEMWERTQRLRDRYHKIRETYLQQKACREIDESGQPRQLKALAVALCPCTVAFAVVFCNQTDRCLRNVVLPLSFRYVDLEQAGVTADSTASRPSILGNSTFYGGFVDPSRNQTIDKTPYRLGGGWPNYFVSFPQIDPYQRAYVTWHMYFPDCEWWQKVELVADAYAVERGYLIPDYILGGGPAGPEAFAARLIPRPIKIGSGLLVSCNDRPEECSNAEGTCAGFGYFRVRLEGIESSCITLVGTFDLQSTSQPCRWETFYPSPTATPERVKIVLVIDKELNIAVEVTHFPSNTYVIFAGENFCQLTSNMALSRVYEEFGDGSCHFLYWNRYSCVVLQKSSPW